MITLDLKKQLKDFYQPSAKIVQEVTLPRFKFVMIDGAVEAGHGPSTSPGFAENTEAIYGLAYTLKFAFKKRKEEPVDYPVMALEGLWWVEDGEFDIRKPDNWKYTLMILLPDLITPADFADGLAQLRKKKPSPAIERLRLEEFEEGRAIQMMHVGPYSTEPATIERMHAFAAQRGYRVRGKHHEIYLGDPRRAQPEKLNTILRHPVEG